MQTAQHAHGTAEEGHAEALRSSRAETSQARAALQQAQTAQESQKERCAREGIHRAEFLARVTTAGGFVFSGLASMPMPMTRQIRLENASWCLILTTFDNRGSDYSLNCQLDEHRTML